MLNVSCLIFAVGFFLAGCFSPMPRLAGIDLPAVTAEVEMGPEARTWWPAFRATTVALPYQRLALWSAALGVLALVAKHWWGAGCFFAGAMLLPGMGRVADGLAQMAGVVVWLILLGAGTAFVAAWYILVWRGLIRGEDSPRRHGGRGDPSQPDYDGGYIPY